MGGLVEETMPGDPLFRLRERIECHECMDTKIAITLYGPERCANCAGRRKAFRYPALQLQEFIFARKEQKRNLDNQPLALARALTHFTAANPLLLDHIIEYYKVDARKAKDLIATLRNEWVLPIGSHRQPPYGSYWIRTPEEFMEWSRSYRSQAITSLATVYRLQKKYFPRLYGQGEFDFARAIADELKEAI